MGHRPRGLQRRPAMRGRTSATTRRARGRTAGARTASPASPTTKQRLCFALALWNGRDPILKERLFGLTNAEGNHGEDVKEYYFYVDNVPTHSYQRWLYKYPHAAFPYEDLVDTNRSRSTHDMEYELVDTGVFDDGHYFDVEVEYVKIEPEDLLCRITVHNRSTDARLAAGASSSLVSQHVVVAAEQLEAPPVRTGRIGARREGRARRARGALPLCRARRRAALLRERVEQRSVSGGWTAAPRFRRTASTITSSTRARR